MQRNCYTFGTVEQDWRCVDCTKAIGAIFGPGKVCSFTRRYYCADCHQDDLCVIPGRLLYSWDGRPQPCARSSQRFLQAVRPRPLFHLRSFNSSLVKFVPLVEVSFFGASCDMCVHILLSVIR
jgi:hypothetical protein